MPVPPPSFTTRLRRSPLLLDGGMGTELLREGLGPGEPPESWVLGRPGSVESVARAYVSAGAQGVLACTFGANRVRLARTPLAGRTAEVARAAVALARRGAGDAGMVFGDLGPTGEWLEPQGGLRAEEAEAAHAELAEALVAAGADGLAVETFTDLREAMLAVRAARRAAPDLPVLASMSFGDAASGHRTAAGDTPEHVVDALGRAGADVVGVNCGTTLADAEAVIERMHRAAPDLPLLAKPNAGLPRREAGRLAYDLDPATFARGMEELADRGVRVMGGCCGTTPAHIRALAEALRAYHQT